MTHAYVDAEVQTDISGLVDDSSAIPPALCAACSSNCDYDYDHTIINRDQNLGRDQDDMSTDILPNAYSQGGHRQNAPSSLLLRRGQAGSLLGQLPLRAPNNPTNTALPRSKAHTQLSSQADDSNALSPTDETTHSPPPTKAALSPLPPANLLHAGHTPILPRAFSPVQELAHSPPQKPALPAHDPNECAMYSGDRTPDLDEALKGPLALPLLPSDGCADRIELKVLDAELEKIARERSNPNTPGENEDDSGASSPTLGRGSPSDGTGEARDTQEEQRGLEGKADSDMSPRKISPPLDEVDMVDGVILKKPRMNMGAPLGQV